LSLKEEAAGKLRVFAMVDNYSQSVLKPLHKALQNLLKIIPNDGTFDQEGSVERSMKKSQVANCAFSFDLTAATDRLPVSLSAAILSSVLGFPLGDAWRQLLVDRNYSFSDADCKKWALPGEIRYLVGQPMGALSS